MLKIGEGSIPISSAVDYIRIPPKSGNVIDTIEELKAEGFSPLHKNYFNAQWLCERAILALRNDCVAHVNNQLLDDFPGDIVVYKSIDTVPDQNAVAYPTEFLNSLEPSGIPPHILKLKVRAPVMVLQNINPPSLYNVTWCIVKNHMRNCIEVTFATGHWKGSDVFLPRIPLIPFDANIPFEFKRLQFPIKVCFAMSINKAQGWSLFTSTLFFTWAVLCWVLTGWLAKESFICAPGGETRNVVYKEAL